MTLAERLTVQSSSSFLGQYISSVHCCNEITFIMSTERFAILALFALTFLSCTVSSTVLIFGKHTDNTCSIRGDWKYIKEIDETIKEVFPEINNRDAFSLVDIRKSPTEVLDLFVRYNYKVASANTVGQDTLWTVQKRRDK